MLHNILEFFRMYKQRTEKILYTHFAHMWGTWYVWADVSRRTGRDFVSSRVEKDPRYTMMAHKVYTRAFVYHACSSMHSSVRQSGGSTHILRVSSTLTKAHMYVVLKNI